MVGKERLGRTRVTRGELALSSGSTLDRYAGIDDKPGLQEPEDCYIADVAAMAGLTGCLNYSYDPNSRT